MSILIKGTNNSSGGGSSEEYSPNEPTLISAVCGVDCAYIRWSDPEDTIIADEALVSWGSTVLVRNENNFPSKISDGKIVVTNTEKDKYKNNSYIDKSLTKNKSYYYRFFVANSTNPKVYYSTNVVFKILTNNFDSVLANNTWDQISSASEAGIASSIWKVGDEIDITLFTENNMQEYSKDITLQIWDFNHFDKSDGTGKAGIVFGMKDLLFYTYRFDMSSNYDEYSWEVSSLRTYFLNKHYYSMIQEDCRSVIKNVKVITGAITSENIYDFSTYFATNDYLFLPSSIEYGYSESYLNTINSKFPIFTDSNSRIKNFMSYSDIDSIRKAPMTWISRQHVTGRYHNVHVVNKDGSFGQVSATEDNGICFCFCV